MMGLRTYFWFSSSKSRHIFLSTFGFGVGKSKINLAASDIFQFQRISLYHDHKKSFNVKRLWEEEEDSRFSKSHKKSFNVKRLWEEEEDSRFLKSEISKENDSHSHRPNKPQIFKYAGDTQEELLNQILEDKLRQENQTVEDWAAIKKQVLETHGSINEENIDAVIINKCCKLNSLDLGKSYFRYLKFSNVKINRASYGNYLLLFHNCSSKCSERDLKEIVEVYKELLLIHPVLDSNTAEKAVFGLSITDNWKEYEQLFKAIEVFYKPSPSVYSVVIVAAFKNKQFDLGWKLLEEMQIRSISTPDEVFINIIQNAERELKEEVLKRVLQFLSRFNIKPHFELSETVRCAFEEHSRDRKGTFTYVLRSGKCKNCNAQLEPASVREEDYEQLKTAFLNPVLIGKDIFQKTKPEEFAEFLAFLKKTAPYDVVLDGLNIAYRGNKSKRIPNVHAFQLQSVVRHFVTKGKKVLVVGKKHVASWPADLMNYVFENAEVFLSEDLSEDDPFLLYATLHSGLGTRFVSRDMMRGHKFLLADPELQATFQKWQAQHQYFLSFVEENGTVHLSPPIAFMQSIQQNSKGDWHIPYATKENLSGKVTVDNFHKKWLCLVNESPYQARGNQRAKDQTHKREGRKVSSSNKGPR